MFISDGIISNTSSTCVDKLPPELLIKIFDYWVTYRDRINIHYNPPSPLILGQVCRKWRHLVLTYSNLWTRVDLRPFAWWPKSLVDAVRASIEASGNGNRLTYHFFDNQLPHWGNQARLCHFYRRLYNSRLSDDRDDLVPTPEGLLERLPSVCFHISHNYSQGDYLYLPMASARTVTISGHRGCSGIYITKIINRLPALEDLTLENISISSLDEISIPELVRFRIHASQVTPSKILPFLSKSLRILDIWHASTSPSSLSFETVDLPQLLELSITPFEHGFITRMRMPRLNKLTVYSPNDSTITRNPLMLTASRSWAVIDPLITALQSHLATFKTLAFSRWRKFDGGDCVSVLERLVGSSPWLSQVHFESCWVDGPLLLSILDNIGRGGKTLDEIMCSLCTKLTQADCDALASRVTKLNVYM